jgi:NAD(P)-dependent dehydrogenase (short-subunit alcohol dehydrogenase family)
MTMKLKQRYDVAGRTVFITGAARGIGAESARRLHAKGANVALVGLEPDRLEALAAELGDRAAWFEADVTDLGALERAAEGTVQRFGGIDVGIANAGIHMTGALRTSPVAQVERALEVNLMGVWRTDRALLPYIVERQGYLLNVASLSAITNTPLMGAYTASKAAVEALTNCLRVETAPTGARIGCAYFGFIETDLVRGAFSEPSTEALLALMPGFVRRTAPLSKAIDAIEDGVARRKARVWAPRYVGGAIAVRGIVQPVLEWRAMRAKGLPEALRLADEAAAGADEQDLLLGVAARGMRK